MNYGLNFTTGIEGEAQDRFAKEKKRFCEIISKYSRKYLLIYASIKSDVLNNITKRPSYADLIQNSVRIERDQSRDGTSHVTHSLPLSLKQAIKQGLARIDN